MTTVNFYEEWLPAVVSRKESGYQVIKFEESDENASLIHFEPRICNEPKLIKEISNPYPSIDILNNCLHDMCFRRPDFYKVPSKDWDGDILIEKKLRKNSSAGTLASLNKNERYSTSFSRKKCAKCAKCIERKKQQSKAKDQANKLSTMSTVLPSSFVTNSNNLANVGLVKRNDKSGRVVSSVQEANIMNKRLGQSNLYGTYDLKISDTLCSPKGKSILIEPYRRITLNQLDNKSNIIGNPSETSILPKRPSKKVSFAEEITKDVTRVNSQVKSQING